jgi:hypothetical protein
MQLAERAIGLFGDSKPAIRREGEARVGRRGAAADQAADSDISLLRPDQAAETLPR